MTIFLYFVLYSFIGWMCETVYCSVIERKFINRGFLNGPFCPIYGIGAILVLNLFSWCSNYIWLLFLLSMIATSAVEYITSYLLEAIFHLQLWDYSKRPINIGGRVCLRNSIMFGLLSVMVVNFIHPFTQQIFSNMPKVILYILSISFLLYFIIDTVFTAKAVLQIDHNALQRQLQLDELSKMRNDFKEQLQKYKQKAREVTSNTIFSQIHHKLSHRRIIKAFPNMKSRKYQEALNQIKQEILQRKKH